jgi:hypothetical protein
MITKAQAIVSLVPNAQVVIRGEEVEWHEPSVAPVTNAQIDAEVARLQAEYNAKEYQRNRVKEYPSLADFADAYYWSQQGDDTKMTAYIEKCEAVKTKYPKS